MPGCFKIPLMLFLVVIASVTMANDETNPEREGWETFAKVCAACHGARGAGKLELKTPSIAALPYWYVEAQLYKFRRSIRGSRTEDAGGMIMHAVAGTLAESQIKKLAAHVHGLPRNPTQNTLNGDMKLGEYLFTEICMACHRYNASGEKVFGSPPLYGLQDWYIAMQLKKFRDGVRGAHKEDIKGAKMHQMTSDLSDADLLAVASYVSVLAERHLPVKKSKKRD